MCLESSEESGQTLAEELESLRKSQEKLMFMIESMKSHRQRAEIHASRLRVLYASFPTTELLVEKLFFDLSLDNIRSESTFEGYLTKKARNSNTWAVRYFVLRDNFLFYYKTDKVHDN